VAATLAAGVLVAALAGAALVGLRVSGREQTAHGTDMAASATPAAAPTSPQPAAAHEMNEPDPGAIIDWLLSRRPGGAGR
jgi:hypothetical protein